MVKKLKRNKKGSLLDILYLGAIITFVAITILFGFKIASEFDANIQADSRMPAESKAASTQLVNYYPGVIDNSFLFLTIGMGIVTLILAALVRIHPVFIPMYLIGLIFVIFFCGILSNIYQELATHPELVTQANQLDMIGFVATGLPWIVGVFGFLLMIVMYKLWSVDQFV